MARRRLILFEVDGVLVRRGELVRPPGAAEGLARLRHETDAVLSVVTAQDKAAALRKTDVVGVNRYLDMEVGAYGSETVRMARERANAAYGCEFTVMAVTAADVARLRQADEVVALSPVQGADHVVASLLDLADLATRPCFDAPVR
nr:hypothetical protein [Kibdelosporangium sp. MJ126-NF4]CEL20079.1 hypothetical protein [Kibdelosporangium sp. MJ126-NF4]CTQ97303.1 hypothetical protein [Kibdelosporangium sp. MJ126-NF4]